MKNKVLNIIMIVSLVLIAFSFIIPNEFNEILSTYPELFQSFWFSYGMYSLTFLLIAVVLSFIKLDMFAYWISLLFLILQTFNQGIISLLHFDWSDYLIVSLGIFTVVISFYYYSTGKVIKKKLLLGIGVVLGVLSIFSVISRLADSPFLLLIVLIIGAYLISLINRINFRSVIILQTVFMLSLLCLLTLNMNCNVRFELDVGYQDWSVENLYLRCSSFYIWIIGGIIINFCIVIKLLKVTGLNINNETTT